MSNDSIPPNPPIVPMSEKDARMWAMLSHLSTLSGYLIPFGHLIAPLIIWSWKGSEHWLVEDQGKESLNYQISFTIYVTISLLLLCAGIGVVLLAILGFMDIILIVVASVKANKGEAYRYPLTIRFVK